MSNRFFVSNSTVTKNLPQFFVLSSTEVFTELDDEVFCAKIFCIAAIINHSGNLNSGHYRCLVKDGETWWHCSDKAVMPVNMEDINKSLPYVLYSFFCDFYFYLQRGLTDHSLIFGN